MLIHTITNLYPYPQQPTRGLFNLQLFSELDKITPVKCHTLVACTSPRQAGAVHQWHAPANTKSSDYIPFQHIPLLGRNLSWKLVSKALKQTAFYQEIQREDQPESCILASWLYPDGIAAAHTFGNTTPVWIMILGTDRFHLNNPRRRKLILAADHLVAGYICVSQNIADDCAAAGLPAEKLHIIRNGVNPELFYKTEQETAKEQLTAKGIQLPDTSHPVILWIGNFVDIKAPQLALRAFAEYKRAGSSKSSLVMIGSGNLWHKTRQLANRLKISESVILTGTRPHTEIPLWLNLADCLILSSHSEGMPNAIAEALACACPVIATDTGACREMLTNQPCTQTVPTNNQTAMADALNTVLAQCRQTSKRPAFNRTWTDMAQETANLLL
jgi:glycosyltransferase involved in cell wall biosynthesis